MAQETKACPLCGEDILAVAIKCKHCGSMLNAAIPATAVVAVQRPVENTVKTSSPATPEPIRWRAGVVWFWIGTLGPLIIFGGLFSSATGVTLQDNPATFFLKSAVFAVLTSAFASLPPAVAFVALSRRIPGQWLTWTFACIYATALVWFLPDWFDGWGTGRYVDSDGLVWFVAVTAAALGCVSSSFLGRRRLGVVNAVGRAIDTAEGSLISPRPAPAPPARGAGMAPPSAREVAHSASGQPQPLPATQACPHCRGTINEGATRCMHCWKPVLQTT